MNGKQPLLNASSKLFIGDDDTNNGNDDTEYNDNDEPVGVFRLFQFANHIDILLMFIAMSLMLLQTTCILAYQILVTRLTGLFVIKSFGDNCDHEQKIFTAPIKINNTYSRGMDLNIFNNALLHK
ncbi:unnamed protein product [Rotaria sordida]|uniref:Uncharacterized protein n=1 Tax=Rotaria sordida TaxID=392033 RepID=A0A814TUL5_9BILA|nr:unnamed protein product [Rotaria sordida]